MISLEAVQPHLLFRPDKMWLCALRPTKTVLCMPSGDLVVLTGPDQLIATECANSFEHSIPWRRIALSRVPALHRQEALVDQRDQSVERFECKIS